ncbi:MAG: sodium:proton antiporter [Dehalococcoidia bacterium]|nr:sodium:proton antiporter [Dehalococcoidia bacterium]MDW8119793.1 MnhB domain-containing protein [Chloroflexota bacterium]
MGDRYPSLVVQLVTRAVVPAIQLFALYVLFHGHSSPGGGFQGGVLLAASIVLQRLVQGHEASARQFPSRLALLLAAIGLLAFIGTGLVPVVRGGAFLDYGLLPLPGAAPATVRYYGILAVEAAIALTVWGTLVAIYDRLSGKADDA